MLVLAWFLVAEKFGREKRGGNDGRSPPFSFFLRFYLFFLLFFSSPSFATERHWWTASTVFLSLILTRYRIQHKAYFRNNQKTPTISPLKGNQPMSQRKDERIRFTHSLSCICHWSLRRHCSTLKHATTTIGKSQGNNKQQTTNNQTLLDDEDIFLTSGNLIVQRRWRHYTFEWYQFCWRVKRKNVMRCCRCWSQMFSSSLLATPFRQIFFPSLCSTWLSLTMKIYFNKWESHCTKEVETLHLWMISILLTSQTTQATSNQHQARTRHPSPLNYFSSPFNHNQHKIRPRPHTWCTHTFISSFHPFSK